MKFSLTALLMAQVAASMVTVGCGGADGAESPAAAAAPAPAPAPTSAGPSIPQTDPQPEPQPDPAPQPAPAPSPVSESAQADWATRTSDAGVVWHHNFDTAAEVNQFRWTGGYNGGNDPQAKGSGGNFVSWQSSGGVAGGGFLRLTYPLGSTAGRGNSYWWRPFNPLTGATNGRGVDDPGANRTIATAAFTISDGSSTLNSWGKTSNPGWYGSPTDRAANPSKYQGNDFYLQVRVRRSDKPGAPPDSAQYSSITGKSVWLTTTNSSYTAQELVTYGQSAGNNELLGSFSRHNIYSGQNFRSLGDPLQPGWDRKVSNLDLNWRYSGGWDTLLYHVTPGTPGGTGSNRTRVEVWAQHDPALSPNPSGYTKIWDIAFSQSYDTGTTSVGSPSLPGWNALILSIYHNGSAFTTQSFNFDYDQVIFSKAFIAAPTQ